MSIPFLDTLAFLQLENAINGFAASVFGELWKLEPLPEDRKSKWRREMDWLLSPANYMVELVPAKQHGANGCTMEVISLFGSMKWSNVSLKLHI